MRKGDIRLDIEIQGGGPADIRKADLEPDMNVLMNKKQRKIGTEMSKGDMELDMSIYMNKIQKKVGTEMHNEDMEHGSVSVLLRQWKREGDVPG